jgi:hypothetical protein
VSVLFAGKDLRGRARSPTNLGIRSLRMHSVMRTRKRTGIAAKPIGRRSDTTMIRSVIQVDLRLGIQQRVKSPPQRIGGRQCSRQRTMKRHRRSRQQQAEREHRSIPRLLLTSITPHRTKRREQDWQLRRGGGTLILEIRCSSIVFSLS